MSFKSFIPKILLISLSFLTYSTQATEAKLSLRSYEEIRDELFDDDIYVDTFISFPRNARFKDIAQSIMIAPLTVEEKNKLWALFLLRSMVYPQVTHNEWSTEKYIRSCSTPQTSYTPAELLKYIHLRAPLANSFLNSYALGGAFGGFSLAMALQNWGVQARDPQTAALYTGGGFLAGMIIFLMKQAKALHNFESSVSLLIKTAHIYKKYLPPHLLAQIGYLKRERAFLRYQKPTGFDYETFEVYAKKVLSFYQDLSRQANFIGCSKCGHLLPALAARDLGEPVSHVSTGYGNTVNR